MINYHYENNMPSLGCIQNDWGIGYPVRHLQLVSSKKLDRLRIFNLVSHREQAKTIHLGMRMIEFYH